MDAYAKVYLIKSENIHREFRENDEPFDPTDSITLTSRQQSKTKFIGEVERFNETHQITQKQNRKIDLSIEADVRKEKH